MERDCRIRGARGCFLKILLTKSCATDRRGLAVCKNKQEGNPLAATSALQEGGGGHREEGRNWWEGFVNGKC